MAELVICCTCLKKVNPDIQHYKLDSDPTNSNDLNLRNKLLFCVPEFEEVSWFSKALLSTIYLLYCN